MKTSPTSFGRWILATLVVLGALHHCESISIKLTRSPPDKIGLLEETNQSLIWDFTTSNYNIGYSVFLSRRKLRPWGQPEEQIANRSLTLNSQFIYAKDSFKEDYEVSLPATLRLINIQRDKNYVYIFKIANSSTPKWYIMYSDVTVEVIVPPQITIAPEREPQFIIGETSILICNASGDPHPSITWTKDGVPDYQFKRSGNFLRLNNVQSRDAGSYRCTASNGYDVTTVSIVGIKCPALHCMKRKVGITIQSEDWKDAYANQASVESKTLESKLLSVIWSFYTKYPGKKLYRVDVDNFSRSRDIVFATVELLFQEFTFDPLKLLQDQMSDGELGPFVVDRTLEYNPTNTPPARSTPQDPPNASAHGSSGLSKSEVGGIIGGFIALVLIIVIVGFIYKKRNNISDLWSQMKHRQIPE